MINLGPLSTAVGLPADTGTTLQSLVVSAIPLGDTLRDDRGHSFLANGTYNGTAVMLPVGTWRI